MPNHPILAPSVTSPVYQSVVNPTPAATQTGAPIQCKPSIPGPQNSDDVNPERTIIQSPLGSQSVLNESFSALSLSPHESRGPQIPPPNPQFVFHNQTTVQQLGQGVERWSVIGARGAVRSVYDREPGRVRFYGITGARPGDTEQLDPSYQVRERPRRFFRVGRVFHMLYPEPAGANADNSTDLSYATKLGERFHIKTRRFIVIRENDSSCTALGIFTYEERGVAKPGVKKSDHVIIHTGRIPPKPSTEELPTRDEEGMRAQPIRIDPTDRARPLHPMSRLNLRKLYNVEHNVKVSDFGMINRESRNAFTSQFTDVWEGTQHKHVRNDSVQQLDKDLDSTAMKNQLIGAFQQRGQNLDGATRTVQTLIEDAMQQRKLNRDEAIQVVYHEVFQHRDKSDHGIACSI